MAPSSTPESPLAALAARGFIVGLRAGRLHVSPPGAPAEIAAEVREHARAIIAELLKVPEALADVPTEQLRALANTMGDFIDGPAPYEDRIRFLPEYRRLVERIGWRTEVDCE